MAMPAVIEPPGELIYSQMSFFGSSAASMSICAQMRLAMSSLTSSPIQMMRSFNRRLKIGSGIDGMSPSAITGDDVSKSATLSP